MRERGEGERRKRGGGRIKMERIVVRIRTKKRGARNGGRVAEVKEPEVDTGGSTDE